jgi:carbon storage regulator
LVLTRKLTQRIVIGSDITVEVLDVDRRTGAVRLGITAPRTTPVNREEVAERLKAANEKHEKGEDSL